MMRIKVQFSLNKLGQVSTQNARLVYGTLRPVVSDLGHLANGDTKTGNLCGR
jgi:hypothetical protein